MNVGKKLWKKLLVVAAEKEATMTELVEYMIREDLDECKHRTVS
jgi:macrodomain Ter protein organizer (MatP/YcbG family)